FAPGVVIPVDRPLVGVQAVQDAVEIAGVDEILMDGAGGHGSAEVVIAPQLLLVLGRGDASVVPDDGGIVVFLGFGREDAVIGHEVGRDIHVLVLGLFGHVNAPEVADALLVLGVLADADVDAVLVDDRGGDEVGTFAGLEGILGVLRVAVELPD